MHNADDDSALLSAILDAAVDAIIVSDEHGTILRANAATFRMFDRAPADLIGRNVSTLMPAEMADHHDGYMAHHVRTGEKRIIGLGRDLVGQRRDGTSFPMHLSVGPAHVDGRKLFVGILHDLTERMAAQAVLTRAQQLDAIAQMTGGIAHDFNNFLTVIIGNLELLQMRGAGDGQKALIDDALSAAETGADLTGRLMLFARKGDLNPVKADLRTIVEDMLSMLRRTLGPRIVIVTELDAPVAPVMIDRLQLQSALLNLALNARDAMPDGGELLLSVSEVMIDDSYMVQETGVAPGSYVCLTVSDDGMGMTPEVQKSAFEPFFTTKDDDGGTGLGLSMVHGFVRQSGGAITLRSEPGIGTSFGLYFRALDARNGGDSKATSSSSADVQARLGAGLTALVVEDNAKVRRLSAQRFRDLGFDVIEADSGDAAHALLLGGARADMLFSDLVMPGILNGYDLAARVRDEFPAMRILLTSGYTSDAVSDSIPHERNYDVLHKPYRQAELVRRLQALLAGPAPD